MVPDKKENGACEISRIIRRVCAKKDAPRDKTARVCVVQSMSADPVTALLPCDLPRSRTRRERRVDAAKTDEVLPSGLRFSHHLRRRIVGRAMLLCFTVSLLCVLAVIVLSSVRVRSVSVSGGRFYTETDIGRLSGVRVGDELLVHHENDIEARLLESCPYLKDVSVKRSSDGFSIRLTECVPCYAVLLEDGRVALMDETRYVAAVVRVDEQPDTLCTVTLPLPTVESPGEEGEERVQIAQIPVEGQYIQGSNAELLLLDSIGQALGEVELGCEVAWIDLSNRYAVTLTLSDGTVIGLHSAQQPSRQLRSVAASLNIYFSTHPALSGTERLAVDVDDSSRVSIRIVPKT